MDEAKSPMDETDPRLGAHLRALGRGAQNVYGRVVDAAAPPIERLQETVKEQPLASVAVAAMTGAVLSKLKGGRRRLW
jgi:ElaB/YqjD/DUF883 family membrane-anchored ribosome-binding protein